MDFQAFEDILVLLIYGLVLFPNSDSFVDVNAFKIFMSRNPVPTLLGDIMHALYTCTVRRRGTLMCCIPLLARLFISHLPTCVLKNEEGMGWAYIIMSLAHTDILWSTKVLHPKIFPLIYKDFSHKTSWTQGKIRVYSTQDISSCTDNPKLGFEFAQGFLDHQCFM